MNILVQEMLVRILIRRQEGGRRESHEGSVLGAVRKEIVMF